MSDIESVYQGQMTIPVDYFMEEILRFREIMCSTEYTIDYMDEAFHALSYVYLNVSPDDQKIDHAINVFVSLSHEFSKRKAYMMLKNI